MHTLLNNVCIPIINRYTIHIYTYLNTIKPTKLPYLNKKMLTEREHTASGVEIILKVTIYTYFFY